MMKHTLIPWKVGWHDRGHGHGDFCIMSDALEGAVIAKVVSGVNDKAIADLIVKACNAYDGLVKACEVALADYQATYVVGEPTTQMTVDRDGRIGMLRDALSPPDEEHPLGCDNFGCGAGGVLCPECQAAVKAEKDQS